MYLITPHISHLPVSKEMQTKIWILMKIFMVLLIMSLSHVIIQIPIVNLHLIITHTNSQVMKLFSPRRAKLNQTNITTTLSILMALGQNIQYQNILSLSTIKDMAKPPNLNLLLMVNLQLNQHQQQAVTHSAVGTLMRIVLKLTNIILTHLLSVTLPSTQSGQQINIQYPLIHRVVMIHR